MGLVRALFIVFACLAVGEGVVRLTGLPFPASIIGMGVLFVLLQLKWVKVEWLQQMTDVLMQNLSLFLVPPCVAVMDYLDVMRGDWQAILTATVVSTLLVMWVSGKSHEWIRRRL